MARVLWEYSAAIVVLVSSLTWLLGALRVVRSTRGMAVSGGAVALLGLVPVGGISAADIVLSISPSLSVAGTALWAALFVRRLTGRDPLGGPSQPDGRGTRALALVVFSVALPLYVSHMGGLGPDVYGSGYGFSPWDLALGASAALAFLRGSRLSHVLLACLAAHSMGLMRSSNIFDALVDGPALLASIAFLLWSLLPERDSLPNRPRL